MRRGSGGEESDGDGETQTPGFTIAAALLALMAVATIRTIRFK